MPDQSTSPHFDIDAYLPAQISARVERAALSKSQMRSSQVAALALLAGAFIGFGALFYTITITDSALGFGPTRLIGGVAFSLGLILVIIAGAELFTGNNLMVMAWADRRLALSQLLGNWLIVYPANFVGSLALAYLVVLSGIYADHVGVGEQARVIAERKLELPLAQAFFRGILCNALVCLAVWLSFAARRVAGKILAVIFPITAFVACGFEHCVANMYSIPVAMLTDLVDPDLWKFVRHLLAVTAGNIVGGSGFVALVYWVIYARERAEGLESGG